MTTEKDAGCLDCDFTTTNPAELDAHKCALKPRSIFIEGRLWHDKINGNTYFSNRIWINGKVIFEMPMEYGYDLQYLHRAVQHLHERGYFEGEKVPSVWEIRDEMGVHFYHVATYGKKSELFAGGK